MMKSFFVICVFGVNVFFLKASSLDNEAAIDFTQSYSIELKDVSDNFVGLFLQQYPGFELKNGLLIESKLNWFSDDLTLSDLQLELIRLKKEYRHGYSVSITEYKDSIFLAIKFEYIDAFELRGFVFKEHSDGLSVVSVDSLDYKRKYPSHGYTILDIPIPEITDKKPNSVK
ncbi:hypothetical protein MLD52_22525 [Puniceicoccaceae bacterium K14]|nr:hypothetical protein [Puniceicoccaceae bacterium K14]